MGAVADGRRHKLQTGAPATASGSYGSRHWGEVAGIVRESRPLESENEVTPLPRFPVAQGGINLYVFRATRVGKPRSIQNVETKKYRCFTCETRL